MNAAMGPPWNWPEPGPRSSSGRIGIRRTTSSRSASTETTSRFRKRMNAERPSIDWIASPDRVCRSVAMPGILPRGRRLGRAGEP